MLLTDNFNCSSRKKKIIIPVTNFYILGKGKSKICNDSIFNINSNVYRDQLPPVIYMFLNRYMQHTCIYSKFNFTLKKKTQIKCQFPILVN